MTFGTRNGRTAISKTKIPDP